MPARLVDDVLGTLDLTAANGFTRVRIDPGFPAVRDSVQDNVNASGTDDSTRFHGARVVSVSALVLPVAGRTRRQILELLRAYVSPGRRPRLEYDEEGDGSWRRILLAGTSAGTPLQAFAREVQATWKAPLGLIEGVDLLTVPVGAVPPARPGVSFPLQFPFSFPAYPVNGAGTVSNVGTEPVAPVYRLWGPCTNPILQNVDNGALIRTGGQPAGDLVLTADQYLEVDVRAGTYRLNGRASDNLVGYVDLLATRLAWLVRGSNRVRYAPTSYSSGARADVLYRPAWI